MRTLTSRYFDTPYMRIALLLAFVGLICPFIAFSQDTFIITLYQPVSRVCEGQIAEFDLDAPFQGDKPLPRDNFYSFYNESACTFRYEKSEENLSLKIEGDGVGEHSITRQANGNYRVKVKFTKTAPYIISWQQTDFYPKNICGKSTEVVRTYKFISTKVVVIPKPPKPTLSASSAIVNYPESITITSADCPNSLAGETDYPYSVNSAFKAWSFDCTTNGQPWFRDNFALSPRDSYFLYASEYFYYNPGTVFRARCNDNGCLSDVSEPLAVSYRRTAPDCGEPMLYEIDRFSNDGREDYHHYMTETIVCNKGDGNPNCTREKVFEILKSSKAYAAPIASDFLETFVGQDLGNWDAKVPMIGSQLLFKTETDSVVNCKAVNLYSYLGMTLNLAALSAGVIVAKDKGLMGYLHVREATALSPISNPVAQLIDERTFSISNYTLLGHILYPGKTTRIVVEECDRIKIITIGVGRSWITDKALSIATRLKISYSAAQAIANRLGKFMGERNTAAGKIIFPNADHRIIDKLNELPR